MRDRWVEGGVDFDFRAEPAGGLGMVLGHARLGRRIATGARDDAVGVIGPGGEAAAEVVFQTTDDFVRGGLHKMRTARGVERAGRFQARLSPTMHESHGLSAYITQKSTCVECTSAATAMLTLPAVPKRGVIRECIPALLLNG